MSKDIPIIFSGPMVKALLEGRKTMTRRILTANYLRVWTGGLDHGGRYVKPGPEMFAAAMNNPRDSRMIEGRLCWVTDPAPHQTGAVMAQWMGRLPWSIGDRLWVRENFRIDEGGVIRDAAGGQEDYIEPCVEYGADGIGRGWKPSIHMPRFASRLTLIVSGVKIERLQDISSDDTIAEGCGHPIGSPLAYGHVTELWNRRAWQSLWEKINGADSWKANPYVVALTFTVHKQNIDTLAKVEAA